MLLCSYWRLIWVKEGFQGDVEQWHRNLNLGPNLFSSNFLVNLFLNSIEAAAFSLKFLRNTSPHTFRDVETAHDTWSATFDWQIFQGFLQHLWFYYCHHWRWPNHIVILKLKLRISFRFKPVLMIFLLLPLIMNIVMMVMPSTAIWADTQKCSQTSRQLHLCHMNEMLPKIS